ncbi:hypothetical protein [Brevundimonas sp. SL130]|uniref:hypothetical protein n=1 Tax=Brevundimonas sp. SL130 TaxID=2995143 RepID=UPI00226D1281|nr:hypothetical protein [Brevundimonas sp. SL130]WAC59764.1 hypothetical protein OU998_16390 [Brevundimonas sp. SL130]
MAPRTPSRNRSGMNPYQRRVALYILITLIAAYVAPLVAAAAAGLVGALQGENGPGALLLLLMTDEGPYGQASTLFTPLIAGLTVTTLWTAQNRRWTYAVIGLCAAGVAAAVALSLILSNDETAQLLYWHASEGADSLASFDLLKNRFLGMVIGALATVIGVLLGLKAVDTESAG